MKSSFIRVQKSVRHHTRWLVVYGLLCLVASCQPNAPLETQDPAPNDELSIAEAKAWFENNFLRRSDNAKIAKTPFGYDKVLRWGDAIEVFDASGTKVILVDIDAHDTAPTPILQGVGKKSGIQNKHEGFNASVLSKMFFYRGKNGSIQTEIALMIPEDDFYEKKGQRLAKFSGVLLITDFQDNFIKGFKCSNGKITGKLTSSRNTQKGIRVSVLSVCEVIDWYSCPGGSAAPYGAGCSYMHTEYIYCDISSPNNGLDYLFLSTGSSLSANINSPYTNFTGLENEIVNARDYLKCFLSNSSPNAQYKISIFVDQPITNSGTPNNGLNGGHTFIGFSKTENGTTITRYLGFYPQSDKASLSAFMPVPSQTHSNSESDYEVSLTYTVSNSQFASAVNASISWGNFTYSLEGFNCTDAAFFVFDAAGLYVPKPVTKIMYGSISSGINPAEPIYMFIHSPAALGQSLRALKRSGSTLNIGAFDVTKKDKINTGGCN